MVVTASVAVVPRSGATALAVVVEVLVVETTVDTVEIGVVVDVVLSVTPGGSGH